MFTFHAAGTLDSFSSASSFRPSREEFFLLHVRVFSRSLFFFFPLSFFSRVLFDVASS